MAKRIRGEGSVYWSDAQKRYVGSVVTSGARKTFCGPRGRKTPEAKSGVVVRLNAYIAQNGANASRETIAAYVDKYVATAPLRTKTKHDYAGLARRHIEGTRFGALRVCDVTAKHVREFIAQQNVGATTQQRLFSLLHRVFQVAIENDDLTINPAAAVRKPRVAKKERPVWSPQEALGFLRVARRHRLYALFVLALTTTMGPGELFGLQRSSVSLKGGYLIVRNDLVEVAGKLSLEETKNASRMRRITLPSFAVEALRARFEIALAEGHGASPFVFTAPGGGPIDQSTFRSRAWSPLLKRARMVLERFARRQGREDYRFPKIRPYDMRHTANALMGHLGIPIQVASRRMGHASIQQTVDTYGHLYDNADQHVADRLQDFFAPLVRGA